MTYVNPAAGLPVRQRASGYAALDLAGPEQHAATSTVRATFPITGQGTVSFRIAAPNGFTVTAGDVQEARLRWSVGEGVALLDVAGDEGWTPLARFPVPQVEAGESCPYWFSFDCRDRTVRFGLGELRLQTSLGDHVFPKAGKDDAWSWLSALKRCDVEGPADDLWVWRDPVTVDPPMRVLPRDRVTMDDLALGQVTVPGSLNAVCQLLYDNVAGAAFEFDTLDFPDFSAAIRRSIDDPNGWCHRRLKEKATLFDPDHPNDAMTYLRITLGRDQGESPGVPFVLEIWPGGHYSPVHNHADANAVIRVLHGRILVTLYPYLGRSAAPFGEEAFGKDEVTWISPGLNQVHQLRNLGREPCITIQCYMYGADNDVHSPEFRDLIDGKITGFAPYSDADFLDFKRIMKEEWAWK